MEYLHRYFDKRVDPRELLPGAKCVIAVALIYNQQPPQTAGSCSKTGKVARYAWGDDYHKIVKAKLHRMADKMHDELPDDFETRACVDTAPLIEREFAAAAGIGWIGKNTLVLRQDLGSYFFLGALVTTLEIAADTPIADHCGTCTACLEACPTDAFPAPYKMDASRCISYLTIEHRGDITRAFQEKMGSWIFGCDECQTACPYNREAPVTTEPRFQIRSPGPQPSLRDLQDWSEDDYRSHLRGSAMKRATWQMLRRNVAIAAKNVRPHSDQAADSTGES